MLQPLQSSELYIFSIHKRCNKNEQLDMNKMEHQPPLWIPTDLSLGCLSLLLPVRGVDNPMPMAGQLISSCFHYSSSEYLWWTMLRWLCETVQMVTSKISLQGIVGGWRSLGRCFLSVSYQWFLLQNWSSNRTLILSVYSRRPRTENFTELGCNPIKKNKS